MGVDEILKPIKQQTV